MGTNTAANLSALFGGTRRAILALLFGHPGEAYYLRQIARVARVGLGATQREVKRLTSAGIIRRTVRGHQVYFQANEASPVFSDLKSLVVKTVGAADVLRSALAPLANKIEAAFIYGSIAKGNESPGSDVDLIVIGGVDFDEVVSALGPAQETLSREVNPTVYPRSEFRSKLRAGHHFLTSVMREPKLFLIGDDRELARLGSKRMAARASKQRRGDS